MPDSAAISWLPPIDTNVRVRGYVLTYGIGAPFDFRTVIDEKQNQHTIRDLRKIPGFIFIHLLDKMFTINMCIIV